MEDTCFQGELPSIQGIDTQEHGLILAKHGVDCGERTAYSGLDSIQGI